MSKSITMSFPHDFTVPDVKKRINERFDLLKTQYIDKLGHADITWNGDVAQLNASAIGQTATATIDVQPATINVEIQLPWLLSALASKVQGVLQSNAKDMLRIGPTKKV